MPKNTDFAAFMRRKLRDENGRDACDSHRSQFIDEGMDTQRIEILNRGVSEETHLKLRKFFLDALILENELER